MNLSKKIICRLFGRAKPHDHTDLKNISSILIRPMGHLIGDTVAHIAYIRQLKTLYPHSRIGILVTGRSRPIYECCTLADELIDDTFSSCLHQHGKWQLYLDFYETYNSRHIVKTALLAPEITIIFHKTPKSYYNTDTLRNYSFHCPPQNGTHITSQLQTSVFADYFTIPQPDISLEYKKITEKGQHYWQHGKLRILLAPQGSIIVRKIPPQEMAILLNNLRPHYAEKCQFLLSNTQGSTGYLAELHLLCPNLDITLAPLTDLRQYLSLTAAADLVIAVDSGSVHLACAFKRPLLCFFANNTANIAKWHPLAAEGIPIKVIISATKNPNETNNFPITEAADWLNREVAALLRAKQGDADVRER